MLPAPASARICSSHVRSRPFQAHALLTSTRGTSTSTRPAAPAPAQQRQQHQQYQHDACVRPHAYVYLRVFACMYVHLRARACICAHLLHLRA
eukprot:6597728-Alexandrium_andersonii.AAC.1